MRAEQVFIVSAGGLRTLVLFCFSSGLPGKSPGVQNGAWPSPLIRARGRGVVTNGCFEPLHTTCTTCTPVTSGSGNMVPPLLRLFLLPFRVQREAAAPLSSLAEQSTGERFSVLLMNKVRSHARLAPGSSGQSTSSHQSQALVQL